jgi:tetratricopeptide (TPR) repeat protein
MAEGIAQHMRRGTPRFWAAAAAGAALLAATTFGPHLPGDFVWDDVALLQKNPDLAESGRIVHLVTSPIEPGAAVYRPLSMATFWLEARGSGLTVAGGRALNVALHVAVAVSVLALLRRLGVKPVACVLAAVVFLVHPSVTEPVMWLNGRHDTLGALFALFALLLVLPRDTLRASPVRLLGAASLGVMALLCKESFVVLPVLVLLEHARRRVTPGNPRPTFADALEVACMAAPLVAIAALRASLGIPGSLGGLAVPGLLSAWATVVAHYGRQLLSLGNGATVQTFAPLGAGAAVAVLTAIAAGLGVLGVLARRGSRQAGLPSAPRSSAGLAAFGLAWFVVALAPAAYAIAVAGQYANRYAYFPWVGLVLALAAGLDRLDDALPSDAARRAVALAVALLALVLAFRTSDFAAAWRDEASLFGADVERYPSDGRALFHFAVDEQRRKGCAPALPLFVRATQLAPDYVRAWHNVAGCLLRLGKYADAIEPARRAAELDPANPRRHYNLGLALAGAGDATGARASFERALAVDPAFLPARKSLDEMALKPAVP